MLVTSLRYAIPSSSRNTTSFTLLHSLGIPLRSYATSSSLPNQINHTQQVSDNTIAQDDLLSRFLLSNIASITKHHPLPSGHHRLNASRVLSSVLPYEPYPNSVRRANSAQNSPGRDGDGIVTVVHMVQVGGDAGIDFVVSSGFIIEPEGLQNEQMVVTCCHTLDQLSNKYPHSPIYSFILASGSDSTPIPIKSFPSMSISDLLLGCIPRPPTPLRSLPISPFPVYKGQKVLVHEYQDDIGSSGTPWIGDMIKRDCVSAAMLGYRNYGWRNVQPGTSSSLPYITFSTRPSPGSSGGPIVDAASGAVVGVVSGSRTMSAVEGERGYGSSAENIFELFSLPGFVPSSQKSRT